MRVLRKPGTQATNLLPCPHCAPEDSNVALYNGGPGCFFVMCGTCNCQTTDGTKDRVIADWNDRTVEDDEDDDGAPDQDDLELWELS